MTSLAGLGRPSLISALFFALAAGVLFTLGAMKRRKDLTDAGGRALNATWTFTLLASIALLSALFARDFSLEYVTNYSSRSLSAPYTLSAFWGGMEGSLLFWTLLLTGFAALALRQARARSSR